jgi:transcriptional regulator of heat shock response
MPEKKLPTPAINYDLSQRQTSLLFAVIKEYCDTAEAIGSKELKEKYRFKYSPATIRNEFAVLRDKGFLHQPYTNATSQPTEKAFRLFVNQLLMGLSATNRQTQELRKKIEELESQQTNLTKEITRMLSVETKGVGFSVSQSTENFSGVGNLLGGKVKFDQGSKVSDILDFLENLDKYKKPLLKDGKDEDNNSLVLTKSKSKPGSKNEIKTFFSGDNAVLPIGKGFAMAATEIYVNNEKIVVGLITPTHMLADKKRLELMMALNHLFGGKDT